MDGDTLEEALQSDEAVVAAADGQPAPADAAEPPPAAEAGGALGGDGEPQEGELPLPGDVPAPSEPSPGEGSGDAALASGAGEASGGDGDPGYGQEPQPQPQEHEQQPQPQGDYDGASHGSGGGDGDYDDQRQQRSYDGDGGATSEGGGRSTSGADDGADGAGAPGGPRFNNGNGNGPRQVRTHFLIPLRDDHSTWRPSRLPRAFFRAHPPRDSARPASCTAARVPIPHFALYPPARSPHTWPPPLTHDLLSRPQPPRNQHLCCAQCTRRTTAQRTTSNCKCLVNRRGGARLARGPPIARVQVVVV